MGIEWNHLKMAKIGGGTMAHLDPIWCSPQTNFMNLKIFLIWIFSISFFSCAFRHNTKSKKESFSQQNCIYEVCFHSKPILIDSLIDQINDNGLMLKVYNVSLDKQELAMNDSLIKRKGYKKLPLRWYGIPHLLSKYIALNDTGYYKYDNSNGERYLILDYTTHKFILFDQGLLTDLYRADSIKGKFN